MTIDVVKSLKSGDVFYESDYGITLKMRATSTPVQDGIGVNKKPKWKWTAENVDTGQSVDYLVTEGLTCYGPNLYSEDPSGPVTEIGLV